MPRTKAVRANKKKSRATKEPAISIAVQNEVADVEKQWQGRKMMLITSRDEILPALEREFEMAIIKMGTKAHALLDWDSEGEEEEGEGNFFSTHEESVTSSVKSPPEMVSSMASSMACVSFSSVATSSRSRDPDPVPCTPAQTAAVRRPLRSSSRYRDNQIMRPPPTAGPLSRFFTPATNTVADGSRYNQITPKIAPNATMSVLRRPVQGEMAFAMSGSPLMVSSTNNGDEVANVNLPLGDGRVLSILPMAGFRPRDLPEMSDDTMAQLINLRNNLESIIAEDKRINNMF